MQTNPVTAITVTPSRIPETPAVATDPRLIRWPSVKAMRRSRQKPRLLLEVSV
jgi:hypothetical protein